MKWDAKSWERSIEEFRDFMMPLAAAVGRRANCRFSVELAVSDCQIVDLPTAKPHHALGMERNPPGKPLCYPHAELEKAALFVDWPKHLGNPYHHYLAHRHRPPNQNRCLEFRRSRWHMERHYRGAPVMARSGLYRPNSAKRHLLQSHQPFAKKVVALSIFVLGIEKSEKDLS
jgi:hypothetical protein